MEARGFPQIRGSFFGVPMVSVKGPPVYGNYRNCLKDVIRSASLAGGPWVGHDQYSLGLSFRLDHGPLTLWESLTLLIYVRKG